MFPTGFLPELKNPNYPCEIDRPEAVGDYLASRNFLERNECVHRLTAAASPGRNATWRVETNVRSFVLKQFRPWPANGRAAPAPEERFRAECQFYRSARIAESLGRALPAMLHQDCQAGCVILEDVGEPEGAALRLSAGDAESLAWFLVALHHHSQSVPASAHYHSRDVVGWQMAHLFRRDRGGRRGAPGRWLGRFAEGSDNNRYALEDAMAVLDKEGTSLVHGHFASSNWVRSADGRLRVIDAEFSFFGPPEFDVGCFLASLLYTRQADDVVRAAVGVLTAGCVRYRARLVAAFAAVHLCDMLESPAGTTEVVRGSRAVALLRRLARVVDTDALTELVAARARRKA